MPLYFSNKLFFSIVALSFELHLELVTTNLVEKGINLYIIELTTNHTAYFTDQLDSLGTMNRNIFLKNRSFLEKNGNTKVTLSPSENVNRGNIPSFEFFTRSSHFNEENEVFTEKIYK